VGARKASQEAKEFKDILFNSLKQLQTLRPTGLDGVYFVVSNEYLVYWEHLADEAATAGSWINNLAEITSRVFDRRGDMSQDFKQYSDMSLEVQLAWEVMTCRAMRSTYDDKEHPCHWFNNHYGPYPAYDWIVDLPQPSATGEQEPSEVEALCVGERYQVPEMMSGCRKAPIMTIGINPNLTAYYPTVDGATWCYPYFDNIGQYAYYFRHRAVCQEQFSVDFIRDNIIPGTEIVAEEDGKVVKTELSSETGGVNLTIQYKGHSQHTMRLGAGYKILFNPYDPKSFPICSAKGEKIAGKIAMKPNTKVTLYRKPVGYYKQFQSIFDTFKKYADPERNFPCAWERTFARGTW
jgi:hypothetical protein